MLLTRTAIISTAPFAVIYAVETLIVKIMETRQPDIFISALLAFEAWIPDLLFIILMFVIFSLLVSRPQKTISRASLVIFDLVMAFSLIITAGDYVYYSATGSGLTWEVVGYWITNFGGANAVISSEITPGRIGWVVVQPLMIAAVLLGLRLRMVREYRGRQSIAIKRKATALFGILVFGVAAAFFIYASKGGGSPATKCVAFDRLRDLIPKPSNLIDLSTVPESERFDDTWEIVRNPIVPRLNVVLIIFESLSWKATDIYAPNLGTTPYLKELAGKSMVVRHSYTVVPHTTKALVALLAGYYPYLDMEPKEAIPGLLPRKSLAYVLKEQGYSTAFFQTADNFERRAQLVANLGYDVFKGLFDMPQNGFDITSYFGREEKMMLKPSLEWVDAQRRSPFFLTYLTLSTHHNYGVPKSYPLQDYGVGDVGQNAYLNAVRYTDEFIKQIMDNFTKRGLLDKTLFMIVGDHGESFGEHGRRQHDWVLWEEGLRSMMMLYGPAIFPTAGTIEGERSILDVIPTVCDVLGLRLQRGHFLGQSLLGPVPENRKLFFAGCARKSCLALKEGPIKTIYHFGQRPMEVFDNRGDPDDKKNLAGRPPYDHGFLKIRQTEMLRWSRVVDAHYLKWGKTIRSH
jgi:lipoteichoic acid synthase